MKGAKVSWEDLTCPKKEGGLGIFKTDTWNKAMMARHIWNICKPDYHSLWVDWVKAYLIKEHSFWEIPIPHNCSWTWRKIL